MLNADAISTLWCARSVSSVRGPHSAFRIALWRRLGMATEPGPGEDVQR